MNSLLSFDPEEILTIKTSSAEETKEIGFKLSKILNKGDRVVLKGDLGAGKTTLVKGIVRGKCGSEEIAKSPSFIILNVYDSNEGYPVFHVDFYRVDTDVLDDIGFLEFENGLLLMEWGEKISPFLDDNTLWVEIAHPEDNISNERLITFKGSQNWKEKILNSISK